MCKIKKIIISMLIAFVTVFSFNMTVGYTSYANDDELDIVYYTVDDSHIGNTSLEEFLDIEAAQNTGIISEDIEVDLNEQGIFDDEIEQFDADMISLLNKGYDYTTQVSYYSISENESSINEDNIMSDAQVNEVINKICNYEEENEDLQASINEILGFSLTAQAAGDTTLSPSGCVKQTLTMVNAPKKNGIKRVRAVYTVTWLSAPSFRGVDIIGVHFKNATPETDSIKCTYTCVKNTGSSDGYGYYYKEEKVSKEFSNTLKKSAFGVAADVNLYNDIAFANYIKRYTNHIICISLYCTVDDARNMKYVVPQGEYYHQKAALELTPSYALGENGGLSVSASILKYTEMIKPNPMFTFYFK